MDEPAAGPDPTSETESVTLTGRKLRMCADGHRALLAMIPTLVVPVALGLALSAWKGADYGGRAKSMTLILIGWNVFAVGYVVLTTRTFSRTDPATFLAQMAARNGFRTGMWRRLTPSGDGPTYAIESSIVAFVVVLVLPHIQGINIDEWLLVPLSISILLSCWALSIVAYSLHYAQHDLANSGLEFPGTRSHTYADYIYFSIAVATTFGATDVSIVTPHMRRVVNLHTILTFIYNSVIVALLAALLIR